MSPGSSSPGQPAHLRSLNSRSSDTIGNIVGGLVVAAAAAAAFLSFTWWTGQSPAETLEVRLPIPANRGSVSGEGVQIEGRFAQLSEIPVPERKGEWPRFRGAGFDNIFRDTALADSWPEEGPPVVWSIDLGEGHAGAAVKNGRVYILDFDETIRSDILRVFSLADGTELWRRWYRTGAKRNHGISRTVPAVTDRYVVTMGPKCHVMCLDADTGEFRWGLDLVRDLGTEEPLWYTAQHPLVENGVAILAPAGEDLMIAVDCETGDILWRVPNVDGWKMSHSSIVPMTVSGQRMYVYAAVGGIAGVAADGSDTGTLLWKSSQWDHSPMSPTPVPLEDGRLFVTAGYGAGSALFKILDRGGSWEAELEKRYERTEFGCEQQTPVYHNGSLITVMPKDAGSLRQQVVAMTPDGKRVFASGKESRFGLGPFMVADGKLLVLNGDGHLTLARAGTGQWEVLASAQVLDGNDAWAPMALVGGLLLARDSKRMVCLDLREEAGTLRASGNMSRGREGGS